MLDISSFNLDELQVMCYTEALVAGWWDVPREPGTLIALMHSELSEALEGVRKDSMDEHIPARKSVEVELADALIRILDFAGYNKLDLMGAVQDKLEYNRNRLDHKKEVRAKEGGKRF